MDPIIFVHTKTGDISVYEDKIVRKVKFMQAGPNNPVGEVTIPISQIVQVEVGENGFQRLLTFKTAASEDRLGPWAGKNSVAFGRKDYEMADKIKDFVEKKILERDNHGNSNKVESVSSADEIKKFKELLDLGIISQEEFDAKKKQLLGL